MKCSVSPTHVSEIVPFTNVPFVEEENTYAVISQSGQWICIITGNSTVSIVCAETGRLFGAHSFSNSLRKKAEVKIRCAVELPASEHVESPCVLLSIDYGQESMICMLDVTDCRVMQAILVPERAISMEVISATGGVCTKLHNLNGQLRYMFGIVAVGTADSHIYFLDLCLDENFECNELLPNITLVVRSGELNAELRVEALCKKQHIFLRMDDDDDDEDADNSMNLTYKNDASVTALKYFINSTTLAVGFSSGDVQLWELHYITLQLSLVSELDSRAIVNFAFQEPENDPRHFCYLWVIRGHCMSDEEPLDSITVATLYSLNFFRRENIKDFGFLYTELQSLNKRLEFPLRSQSSALASCLLSCQVIGPKELSSHMLETSLNDSFEIVSDDTSLLFISWAEDCGSPYHMAVFDLNQWYQAQMPAHCGYDPSSLNSYLGIFSLSEAAVNFSKCAVLGVFTIPQSLKKFKSLTPSDQFFYPSSIGFQTICFADCGLCKISYLGLQKQILFEIAEQGPKALLNPKEAFTKLITSGLTHDSHGGPERTPLVVQKEAILQSMLEYHMPFFFMKCLKEWCCGESIHEGYTSKYLLVWIWKRITSIRSSIDKHYVPLFNCEGNDISKDSLKYLYYYKKQLSLIESILGGFRKYATLRTDQALQDLVCRMEVATCLIMYLKVVLWLHSSHVLPEVWEDAKSSGLVVYKVHKLTKYYAQRRDRGQPCQGSMRSNAPLMIDSLVKELDVGPSWLEKGGSTNYPPPSIYAALGVYLLYDVPLELKHSFIYYMLLELQKMNRNNNTYASQVLLFPVVFDMPQSLVQLTQAFWYLDQCQFELAMKHLFSPSVNILTMPQWKHNRIIKSFLSGNEHQKALKYLYRIAPLMVTLEEAKFHITVQILCGDVTQAFEYQRRKRKELSGGTDLINHFFQKCQETEQFRDLRILPFNEYESNALMEFLSSNEDPAMQEFLVMYNLLHCNFFDAEKVNQKLERTLAICRDSNYSFLKERSKDRALLIESFMAGIPQTEKMLLQELKTFTSDQDVYQPFSRGLMKDMHCMPKSYMSRTKSAFPSIQPPSKDAISSSRTELHYRNLPFIGPPPPPPEGLKSITAVGASGTGKRNLLPSSPTEYSSPAKRSRLLDNVAFRSPTFLKKKTPKHLLPDVASVLHSPPIHRELSKSVKVIKINLDGKTPHSILKKKEVPSRPAVLVSHRAETPPVFSKDTSDEEIEVDQPESLAYAAPPEVSSRQIKFDLPIQVQDNTSLSESLIMNEEPISLVDNTLDTVTFENKSIRNLIRDPLPSFSKSVTTSAKVILEREKRESTLPSSSKMEGEFLSASEYPIEAQKSAAKTLNLTKPNSTENNVSMSDSMDEIFYSPVAEMSEHPESRLTTQSKPHTLNFNISEEEEEKMEVQVEPPTAGAHNLDFLNADTNSKPFVFSEPLDAFNESTKGWTDVEKKQLLDSDNLYVQNTDSNSCSRKFVFSEPIDRSRKERMKNTEKDPQQPSKTAQSLDVKSVSSGVRHFKLDSVHPTTGQAPTKSTAEPQNICYPHLYSSRKDSGFSESAVKSSVISSEAVNVESIDSDSVSKPFVFSEPKDVLQSSVMMDLTSCVKGFGKTASGNLENEDSNTGSEARFVFSPPIDVLPKENIMHTPNFEKDLVKTGILAKKLPRSFGTQKADDSTPTKLSLSEKIDALQDDNTIEFDYSDIDTNESALDREANPISKDHDSVFLPTTFSKSLISKSSSKNFIFGNDYTLTDRKSESGQTVAKSKKVVETPSQELEKKHVDSHGPKSKKAVSASKTSLSTPKVSSKIKFLQGESTDTYEEFSSSLSKGITDSASSKRSTIFKKKVSSSSPEKSRSLKEHQKSQDDDKPSVSQLPTTSQASSTTASLKKTKPKGKTVKKTEFLFAEPHSPVSPEMLKALEAIPEDESPPPKYVFSPPLTRGRLRQRTLEMSESSILVPPTDSSLQTITEEKKSQPKKSVPKKAKRGSRSRGDSTSSMQESMEQTFTPSKTNLSSKSTRRTKGK